MFEAADIKSARKTLLAERNGTAAVEEEIDASHYVLVVFVITIVVASSLYFFVALGNELRHSFSHFCKVKRSAKKKKREELVRGSVDGGANAPNGDDTWGKAKTRRSEKRNKLRFPSELKGDSFKQNANPLHSSRDPTHTPRLRFNSTNNPAFGVGGGATDSAESKTASHLGPALNQFKASGGQRVVKRASSNNVL
jgi:hypothetical protein